MRIAHAFLLGKFGAVEYHVAVIEVGERVAVTADRHIGALVLVFEINHKVSAEIFFFEHAGSWWFFEFGHNDNPARLRFSNQDRPADHSRNHQRNQQAKS
ncbi:hypothetical protein ACFL6K_04200 [Candidatus Latescibacterota bacterium]